MNQWISTEEELPYYEIPVLVCDEISGKVSIGKLIDDDNDDTFKVMHIDGIDIDYFTTHWMPLPEFIISWRNSQ